MIVECFSYNEQAANDSVNDTSTSLDSCGVGVSNRYCRGMVWRVWFGAQGAMFVFLALLTLYPNNRL